MTGEVMKVKNFMYVTVRVVVDVYMWVIIQFAFTVEEVTVVLLVLIRTLKVHLKKGAILSLF